LIEIAENGPAMTPRVLPLAAIASRGFFAQKRWGRNRTQKGTKDAPAMPWALVAASLRIRQGFARESFDQQIWKWPGTNPTKRIATASDHLTGDPKPGTPGNEPAESAPP
jgi:hypothetical protein